MKLDWDYTPSIKELEDQDYLSAVNKIDCFFDCIKKDLDSLAEKKIWILVDKTGKYIFSEQKNRIHCLSESLILNDTNDLKDKYACLKDNVILVFDDAIKTGRSVERILSSILPASPQRIIVIAIIAAQETLEYLKQKYEGNINFVVLEEIPGNLSQRDFDIAYHRSSNKILEAYIKYTCKPRQDEEIHPYLLIKFGHNTEFFFKLFESFSFTEDIDDGFKFEGRFIKSIILDDRIIESIITQICLKDVKFKSALDAFIRVFYRGDLKEIILQPVLRRHDDSYIDNPSLLEAYDYFMKLLIINYLIGYILPNLREFDVERIHVRCNNKSIL